MTACLEACLFVASPFTWPVARVCWCCQEQESYLDSIPSRLRRLFAMSSLVLVSQPSDCQLEGSSISPPAAQRLATRTYLTLPGVLLSGRGGASRDGGAGPGQAAR